MDRIGALICLALVTGCQTQVGQPSPSTTPPLPMPTAVFHPRLQSPKAAESETETLPENPPQTITIGWPSWFQRVEIQRTIGFPPQWITATNVIGTNAVTLAITEPAEFFRAKAPTLYGVTLGWDASPDTDVTGYNVYWGEASRVYSATETIPNVTTAAVTNLVPGVTYYFTVTAFNGFGLESEYSNEVSFRQPPPPPLMLSTSAQ